MDAKKVIDKRPLIVDVKRHALHDGPGIRSTVFFKGCPLNCLWCHNPEAISPEPEIAFYPDDCIGCGRCGEACPNEAIQLDSPHRINRLLCQLCGKCASACPGTALRIVGKYYELDQLVELLLRDKVYYETSGGGVTLSGGEPTLYIDYASRLACKIKEHGVSVTIETSGYFNYETFKSRMLPSLSLILYDIKLMDSEEHLAYTGRENQLILENFRRLAEDSPIPIIPRTPLIPGITARTENLRAIAEFIKKCGLTQYSLLPYNPLGPPKRENIGKEPVDLTQEWMAEDQVACCRKVILSAGLTDIPS